MTGAQVFISHAGPDLPIARELSRALEGLGISTWLDSETLLIGNGFVRQIGDAIRACRIFLLIDSPASRRSYWVGREVQTATRLTSARTGVRLVQFGGLPREEMFRSVPTDPEALAQHCRELLPEPPTIPSDVDTHRVTSTSSRLGERDIDFWIGFSDELAKLDRWWSGVQPGISIFGPRSCGKTAMTMVWIAALSQLGFRDAARVQVWLFSADDYGSSEPSAIGEKLRIFHRQWDPAATTILLVADGLHPDDEQACVDATAKHSGGPVTLKTMIVGARHGGPEQFFDRLELRHLSDTEMDIVRSQVSGRGRGLTAEEETAIARLFRQYQDRHWF